ncbi:MAG: hypothetical protein AAF889_01800 [Cyanobacteria bacterium P01_D01_bin.73]
MGILQKLFGLGNGESYFLDDDDAKTFGDIDYMRKEITVERTYPKGKAEDVPVDKYVPPALDKPADNKPRGQQFNNNYAPQVQSYTPPAPTSYTPPAQSFAPQQSFTPQQNFTPQAQSFGSQQPAPQAPAPQAPAQPAAQAPQPPAQETPAPTFTPPPAKESKPSGDDGMDMFRSMAKNIRR